MKRAFTFLCALALAAAALAQTPQAILSRMEDFMKQHDKDGLMMYVDVKVPIIGTMSTRTYALGKKARIEANMMGVDIVSWTDGETAWTYNSKDNRLEIDKAEKIASSTQPEGDISMFSGITEGYDLSLEKETQDAWSIRCKKKKDNTDKDAPKTIDLTVAKGTYAPVSLSTKISGIGLTMRDLSYGVTEQQVTFRPDDYPDATVVDKR